MAVNNSYWVITGVYLSLIVSCVGLTCTCRLSYWIWSLCDQDPTQPIRLWENRMDPTDPQLYTTEPRCLLFHMALVSFIWKKVIMWWQTSLGKDGHSLQYSCCKFFKTYLHDGFCGKLKNLANKLRSNFADGRESLITWSLHDHFFWITWMTPTVCANVWDQ